MLLLNIYSYQFRLDIYACEHMQITTWIKAKVTYVDLLVQKI